MEQQKVKSQCTCISELKPTLAKEICCSVNIFCSNISTVGVFRVSSNSTNSCTKNSGSVPNGRLVGGKGRVTVNILITS